MGSPIHFHGPRIHHHHEAEVETSSKKKIKLRQPDQAQDVVETSRQTAVPKTRLERLLGDRLSVGAYADAVEIPKMKHKRKLFENDRNLSDAHSRLLSAKADTAIAIRQTHKAIGGTQVSQQALSEKEASETAALNGQIQAYNDQILPEDQAQMDILNNATASYNAGEMSEAEYTDIVDAYNDYAAGRNADIQTTIDDYQSAVSTFNTQVGENNETVNGINSDSGFGIPDVPVQTPVAPQGTSLLPLFTGTVPNQTANAPEDSPPPYQPQNPPITETLVDSRVSLSLNGPGFVALERAVFMETYFQPIKDTLTAGMEITDRRNDYIVGSEDYRRTFHRGNRANKIAESDTFISRSARQTSNSSRTGGSGHSLRNVSGGDHAERSGSNSLFSSAMERFRDAEGENLMHAVSDFSLLTLQNSGLFATLPASQSLRLEGLTPEDAHFNFQVAAGVSVTVQISDFVQSGASEKAIRRLVESQIGDQADKATIDQAVELLTAAVNIYLLQTALASAGIALRAPGLATQLAANVEGFGEEGITTPLSPGEVLSDGARREFLTLTLANLTGIDQSAIDATIQAAITAGKTSTAEEFRQFLFDAFSASHPDKAAQLADNALLIVQSEGTGSRIFHTDLLDRNKTINLLSKHVDRDVATAAIDAVLNNSAISNDAEFAAALQIQLTSLGVNSDKAARVAANVVDKVASTGESSPLEEPEPRRRLKRRPLRAQLTQHVVQLLTPTLGSVEARQHADRIVELLVGTPGGAPSTLDLLNFNVKRFLKATDGKVGGAIRRSFREFISPSIDAFIFNNKLLDPANTFLLSDMTSTRLTGAHKPTNYIKYLEFHV